MECPYHYKDVEWPPRPGWTYLKGQIPTEEEAEARKNLTACIEETNAIIEMLDNCVDIEKREVMFRQLEIAQAREMEASNLLNQLRPVRA